MIPHIPVVEIMYLLLKLRHNQTFLRVGRILVLALVALVAIGCAGVWGKAYPPDSLPCTIGKYECYQGEPFGMLDLIYRFGASEFLLLIPVLELLSALLLLLMPPRTYLMVFALNLAAFAIYIFGMAHSAPINYDVGGSDLLTLFSICLCAMFCFPLLIVEHANLNQGRDIFAGFMGEP